MQIVILQRLPNDLEKIKAAMEKSCPELIEKTHFYSRLDDAKKIISTKKKFLAQREFKDVIVVTGTVLQDESTPKVVNKLKDWNPGAEIIIFSVAPGNVIDNKKLKKKISVVIVKNVSGPCYTALAEHIKTRHELKTKK